MARHGGIEFPEPEILATAFELVNIAQGHPTALATVDGSTVVTVRLYTPDELMAANRRACERYPGGPPPMSEADAYRLTRPLPE
jgi:hypothetical protein